VNKNKVKYVKRINYMCIFQVLIIIIIIIIICCKIKKVKVG